MALAMMESILIIRSMDKGDLFFLPGTTMKDSGKMAYKTERELSSITKTRKFKKEFGKMGNSLVICDHLLKNMVNYL